MLCRDLSITPEQAISALTTCYSKGGEEKKADKEVKPKASAKRFVKPELKQCMDYFAEKGSTVYEGEKMYDFYEANGWRVGKNPMKDWKAAARNWMKNN